MAIKCNNKTHLHLQAAVYCFMGWMFLRNGPYRPISLSRNTIIQHSVNLEYYILRSPRTRLNSKLTYPDISIRLCGNRRIPFFHIIWMEKGRPVSWRPHSPNIVLLILFWELSCKVRRASLKQLKEVQCYRI